MLNVAVGAPANVSTFPNAAATSAAVPVIFMLFVTVIVPVVEVLIVLISVAAILVALASVIVTFPVYAAANVPANAAAKSAVDPVKATL